MRLTYRISFILSLLTLLSFELAAQTPAQPQLWYWQSSYLTSPSAVQSAEALIDKAAAAGYTGVTFFDSSFSFMAQSFWPAQNVGYMKQTMDYATSKGLKVLALAAPYGHSADALQNNPNWGEAQRVVGSKFKVNANATALQFQNSFPGLDNSNFSSGTQGWFDMHDQGVSLDQSVGHSGNTSALIQNAQGNSRLRQAVQLTPWRQYHLRLWYKTQSFNGYPSIYMFDASNFSVNRLYAYIGNNANSNWTELDFTFNSMDTTSAYLYLGCWGGSAGNIWFDDIQLEETSLVYLARRSGTPITMYDANNPSTTFNEGTDFNYVSDRQMSSARDPFYNEWHTAPTVTLPAGTNLKPGQVVGMDSYSIFPVPGGEHQVGLCLTEPGVMNWLTKNAQAIDSVLPPTGGYFLSYDEMRQMDSCGGCKAKNMTPGQLLAWHVQQSTQVYRAAGPNAPLYVWSDMFDPYHNAVNNYASVEGDLKGSWQGLPSDITIMNWNLGNLTNSLKWFAGKNSAQPVAFKQIISGYYDSGYGAGAARVELAAASGIPGVQGLMYTTWNMDYSQLQQFADSARANWPAYVASLNGGTGGSGGGTGGGGNGGGGTGGSGNGNPPPPPVTLPKGAMNIVVKATGRCLDLVGSSATPTAAVDVANCNGSPTQAWNITAGQKGAYQVSPATNSALVIGVNGGPNTMDNGARFELWTNSSYTSQQFQLTQDTSGDVQFAAVSNQRCFDSGSASNGSLVQQWTCYPGTNQSFSLLAAATPAPVTPPTPPSILPTGPVTMVLKANGRCVDLPVWNKTWGAAIQAIDCTGSANQQWIFTALADGSYQVSSVSSGMIFDVYGGINAKANGSPIQQWQNYGGTDQRYWVVSDGNGYYHLQILSSGLCLAVQGGPLTNYNGAPLNQWTCNGQANEEFLITAVNGGGPDPLTTGTMNIVSKAGGRCLDVAYGSSSNGAGTLVWQCWGSADQQWNFKALGNGVYEILNQHSGLSLDIFGGPGATSNGVLLQQWKYIGGSNQQFRVVKDTGGSYSIHPVSSGICLDVQGGPTTNYNGAKLQQYSCAGSDNQRFQISAAH